MSLDDFVDGVEVHQPDPNYSSNSGKTNFFSEDMPHEAGDGEVSRMLATEMNYIPDQDFAREVAEVMGFPDKDRVVFVIEVIYNDGTKWYWPFRPFEEENTRVLDGFLEDRIKEVKTWRAIQDGKDPSEVITEWEWSPSYSEVNWAKLMDTTELEEVNKWDVVERFSAAKIEKSDEEKDYSWMDEW